MTASVLRLALQGLRGCLIVSAADLVHQRVAHGADLLAGLDVLFQLPLGDRIIDRHRRARVRFHGAAAA